MTPTICAISTPHGTGGIATIRISGPKAFDIVETIWSGPSPQSYPSHTVHLGTVSDPQSDEPLDTAVLTLYRGPKSFTGEDTVELTVHGSPWIQNELINLLIRQGATPAGPGEFTRRAVANGKMDLSQAEAIADIIATQSKTQQRIALSHLRGHLSAHLKNLRDQLMELAALTELELDFSEEDVQFASRPHLLDIATQINTQIHTLTKSFASGQAIKRGINVAITGPTNAGKSTLLNALLGEDKAIVSNIHGTTRDTIEDTLEINGILFRLIDTAGLRQTSDPIERIGIERTHQAIDKADIIIRLQDPSDPSPLPPVPPHTKTIDLITKVDIHHTPGGFSSLRSQDIDRLKQQLTDLADPHTLPSLTITNARHYQALLLAGESTQRIIDGLDGTLPTDLIAQDIRQTIHHLSSITDPITTPDILNEIFTRFCIGK